MTEGENGNIDFREEKIELKAILVGNSGVGKTNLINRCVGLKFDHDISSTTSGTFVQKPFKIDDKNYVINLWDTAGQERYKSLTKIFLKSSDIVIFVYDITDIQSFKSLEEWISICKEMINNEYVCGIVGNKMDLFTKEQVKEDEARKYADQKGMQFQLCSAKDTPQNFEMFLKDLLEEHQGISKSVSISKENIKLNERVTVNKKCNC